RQKSVVESDREHEAYTSRVPQRSGDERNAKQVKEVRENSEQDGEDQADRPTGDGRQKCVAKQRLNGVRAKAESVEKPEEGQKDKEKPISADGQDESEEHGER